MLAAIGQCLAKVDVDTFKTDKSVLTMAFDLTDQNNIEGGLIIFDRGTHAPELSSALIPFQTTGSDGSEALLSTWGSYGNSTYITYLLPGTSQNYYTVNFKPKISYVSDEHVVAKMADTIIFVDAGQEKTFYFKYSRV